MVCLSVASPESPAPSPAVVTVPVTVAAPSREASRQRHTPDYEEQTRPGLSTPSGASGCHFPLSLLPASWPGNFLTTDLSRHSAALPRCLFRLTAARHTLGLTPKPARPGLGWMMTGWTRWSERRFVPDEKSRRPPPRWTDIMVAARFPGPRTEPSTRSPGIVLGLSPSPCLLRMPPARLRTRQATTQFRWMLPASAVGPWAAGTGEPIPDI